MSAYVSPPNVSDSMRTCHRYQIGPAALFSGVLLALTLTVFAVGCGSSSTVSTNPASASSSVVDRWETAAAQWEGVPHRWGGTSRSGIDCSALVQTLYRDVSGVRLPRTTQAQARTGTRVRKRDLKPGDLVFFYLDKTNHVGVHIEGGRFVHASSSNGVMISHIDEPYWAERYWTARRISSATASEPSTSSPSSSGQGHGGW